MTLENDELSHSSGTSQAADGLTSQGYSPLTAPSRRTFCVVCFCFSKMTVTSSCCHPNQQVLLDIACNWGCTGRRTRVLLTAAAHHLVRWQARKLQRQSNSLFKDRSDLQHSHSSGCIVSKSITSGNHFLHHSHQLCLSSDCHLERPVGRKIVIIRHVILYQSTFSLETRSAS